MAIDHSTLTAPPAIRLESPSSSTAYIADEVTPPAWAKEVALVNSGGEMRVGSSGTDGAALTEYLPVADGSGYVLQLQGDDEVNGARSFFVSVETSSVTVAYDYRSVS